jgi:hypothetical protein
MHALRLAIHSRRMSTHLFRCLTLLMLLSLIVFLSACGSSRHHEAGPANEGLRLLLAITSSRSADQDVHHVTLQIVNTRSQPVTLTAAFLGGPQSAGQTYADFIASATRFSSYPMLKAEPFQTGGGSDLPQPVITLPAGGSTTANWMVTGDTFTGYDSSYSLTLPMPGLFLLRAHLPVRIDQQEIVLWSNEAACSIGGSQDAPRKCSTTILSIADDQSVNLAVGTRHGVAPGDRYVARTWDVHLISELRWTVFEVTKVKEWNCTAVVRDGHPSPTDAATTPVWFPAIGFEVFLIGPRNYRR